MSGDAAKPSPASASDIAVRLAVARAATLSRLDALEAEYADITAASVNSNADDEHDPEGPTIAFERSQVRAMIVQARRHLTELDAAETRLAENSYGRCQSCGEPISPARLMARLVARQCLPCASQRRGQI